MVWNRRWFLLVVFCLSLGFCQIAEAQSNQEKEKKPTIQQQLKKEALKLSSLVQSKVAKQFLSKVDRLPNVKPKTVYYDRANRKAVSVNGYKKLGESEKASYKKVILNQRYYFTTRYGSPLAFVRPLEIAGQNGLEDLEGARVADFGFGTIGHLMLMAENGAKVFGIEVDSILEQLYFEYRAGQSKKKLHPIDLAFGSFPADLKVAKQIPNGLDLFVSKNTLKRGYIHPSRPAPKNLLIDLGVTDEKFCREVFDRLKPGGMFLIYNLHPAQAPEGKPYIPWADGRCPFEESLVKKVGFEVIQFDKSDTAAAHKLALALGWGKPEDLKKNLFATYTLLRKPKK